MLRIFRVLGVCVCVCVCVCVMLDGPTQPLIDIIVGIEDLGGKGGSIPVGLVSTLSIVVREAGYNHDVLKERGSEVS